MARKSRKSLVRLADKYYSLYIRKRDKFCVTCGSKDNLQCGHLFSRVSYTTRWDDLNGHAQCRECNLKHEYNPHVMTNAFIKKFGQQAYERLLERHLKTVKFTNNDLNELITCYSVLIIQLRDEAEGKY